LKVTGYIPIQTKNYREFSLFRPEDEDFGNRTIFNFLKIVVENDLYFNVMCDATSGTGVPLSTNQVTVAVTHNKRKQTQPRTNWEENVLEQKQSFLSFLIDNLWDESSRRIKRFFCYHLESVHEELLLFLFEYGAFDTSGYLDWCLQGKHDETVSKASRGRGMTTRRQAILEASEMEGKAFLTCPRAVLLRKASAGSLKDLIRRVLDLSRNHQQDPIKMQEHQRYVNIAMMEIRSIEMLKYFVEEEHADVNYIDRSSGRTIMFNIYDHVKLDRNATRIISYLVQKAGFHHIEHRVEECTILQLAMRSKRFDFVDALLLMAYGYRTESNTFHPVERVFVKNINACLIENGTMNPLTYAVTHYDEQRRSVEEEEGSDEESNEEDESEEDDSEKEDRDEFLWRETRLISHFLKQHQANVNAKDRKGNTAVLYAVQNNCLQLS
jgi:hypothetical protein